MRRLLLIWALFVLLLPAYAEEAALPETALTLPAATSDVEVEEFLIMPGRFTLAGVERGKIRYIAQNEERDDMFRTGYWLGGEKGSVLDLTLRERYGNVFENHAGVMCSRAAYSMAMSYLGIDVTPGDMSAMLNTRNLEAPYDIISWMLGVDQVDYEKNAFNQMVENYLADDSYSPIYLYLKRPDGTYHAVLVVATIPSKGRYLVVDSNPPQARGKLYRVYFISLNKMRTEVINSTFNNILKGSKVVQLYQWRLLEDPADAQ